MFRNVSPFFEGSEKQGSTRRNEYKGRAKKGKKNKRESKGLWVCRKERSSFFHKRIDVAAQTGSERQFGADRSSLSTYLSLALFACLLSFSFSILTSGGSSSFPEELLELKSSSSSNSLRILS
jgi:hypothetical protein